MDLQNILLIVIAIILIYLIAKPMMKAEGFSGGLSVLGRGCSGTDFGCPNITGTEGYMGSRVGTDRQGGNTFTAQENYGGLESYGHQMINENIENFASCQTGDNKWLTDGCGPCSGGGQDKIDFSVNEFGAPGMDYKEFVASQAVDSNVVANHVQYVSDREALSPGGFFTGRTFSPDSHESFDPIYWLGLRRPDYVNECNPTQTTGLTKEDQYRLFKGNRLWCLKT
jgi:hypothetical protein